LPKDALGPGLPDRDLVLSPNHRVLVEHAMADMLFAEPCALMAAKVLAEAGLARAHGTGDLGVAYNHLLFHDHEVVFSNGLPSESLYPGPMALEALDDAAQDEIRALFPEALDPDFDAAPAALILRKFEAELLLDAIFGTGRTRKAA
jgi:hypothetical protein